MSGPPLTVLVIDDNRHIRRLLREGFALEGFGVREAGTADAGFTWARLAAPDLVILDLELADIDGAEVIERLRSWSRMPIIVLSGRSNAADTARLLDLGAADYLVKPFELAELVSRARAALRNDLRAAAGALRVQVGPLSMDFARCTAELAGVRLELTPKQYKLLRMLAEHAQNLVTDRRLLDTVLGTEHGHDLRHLRLLVRELRQRIEADPVRPRLLMTEPGIGYRLAAA